MFEELFDLLAHAKEYECCWDDGQLYLRKKDTEGDGEQEAHELEAASGNT